MVTVTVTYPRQPGATFDHDYYMRTHVPMVWDVWGAHGLVDVSVLKGLAAADGGEAPYVTVCLIQFESPEALQQAMANPDAGRLTGDVPNFTNIAPVIQVNEPLA